MERTPNIAVFVDYENVALGAAEAGLDGFDIRLVLARLLDRGRLIAKRAYCDWTRYASSKRSLHEAGFELLEVPHARYVGKNSADIRLVVDAIDLCHTNAHIDTFAVVSGDSDFSPLVAKLRENAREVVGIGVKASTSRVLLEACDAFVYYDDLVRTERQERGSGDPDEALKWVADTAGALLVDRDGSVWGSHIKQVLKRKRPHFAERHYGFDSFSAVLESAQQRGMLDLVKDVPSGGYLVTATAH